MNFYDLLQTILNLRLCFWPALLHSGAAAGPCPRQANPAGSLGCGWAGWAGCSGLSWLVGYLAGWMCSKSGQPSSPSGLNNLGYTCLLHLRPSCKARPTKELETAIFSVGYLIAAESAVGRNKQETHSQTQRRGAFSK